MNDNADRRPWPRNPKYLVGADGSIVGPRGTVRAPSLAPSAEYPSISIYRPDRKRSHSTFVHIIVCETFHGARPPGTQVAHLDGNPLNSAASNLAWKTAVENEADKIKHGSALRGTRNPQAILTEATAHQLYAAYRSGPPSILRMEAIAAEYGVALSTAKAVVYRGRWRGGEPPRRARTASRDELGARLLERRTA